MARTATRLMTAPVTVAEATAAAGIRADTHVGRYLAVLTIFRGDRRMYVSVSRQDLKVAAGARGRAMASGMCDRDAWRAALAADLDRLVRGVAGTDVR